MRCEGVGCGGGWNVRHHKYCFTVGRPELKKENAVDLGIAGTILKWVLTLWRLTTTIVAVPHRKPRIVAFYVFIQQIYVLIFQTWYILSVFISSKCSLFHNSNVFGSCIIHILYTGCAKIKKKFWRQKVNGNVSYNDIKDVKEISGLLYENRTGHTGYVFESVMMMMMMMMILFVLFCLMN